MIKNVIVYSKKLPPRHIGGIETNAFYLIRNLSSSGKYNLDVFSIGNPRLGFLRRKSISFDGIACDVYQLKKNETLSGKKVLSAFGSSKFRPNETLIYHNSLDLHKHFQMLRDQGFRQVARSGGNDLFFIDKRGQQYNELHANINYIDQLLVNSQYSLNRSVSLGLPPEKMSVIRGGCEPSEVGRSYPIPMPSMTAPIILTCGRLVDFKGIEDALRALALVRDKQRAFHFAVVGDGELRSTLELLVKELNLDSYCKFYGKVPPQIVQEFYKQASIYLSSSKDIVRSIDGFQYTHTETMGRSICESQINGVPAVVTDAGGAIEMLVNDKTGFVVPQGNIDQMADALIRLIDDVSLRESFSVAAKAYAKKEFGWETVITKTMDIIDRL